MGAAPVCNRLLLCRVCPVQREQPHQCVACKLQEYLLLIVSLFLLADMQLAARAHFCNEHNVT